MRIVIKIGTSTITHPTGRLNIRQMEALCKVLSDLKNAGNEVILVSSGAIGMGVGKLRLGKKPVDVPTKQAVGRRGPVRAHVHLRQAVLGIPPHRRADPADGGRHRRPRAARKLPEHHPAPAGAGRDPDHQRERHRLASRNSASATTIRSRPSWPPASGRICWSCSRTSTGCIPPTRTKIRTRSASTWSPEITDDILAPGRGQGLRARDRRHEDEALRRADRHEGGHGYDHRQRRGCWSSCTHCSTARAIGTRFSGKKADA